MVAALHAEEVFRPDLRSEAKRVHGTEDTAHPEVGYLLEQSHPCAATSTSAASATSRPR